MGIDQVVAMVLVTGEVYLADGCDRYCVDEGARVEAVIYAAYIDVVHVEQQLTASTSDQFSDELPLAHLVGTITHVTGNVFQQQGLPESVLDLGDTRYEMAQGRFRVWEG